MKMIAGLTAEGWGVSPFCLFPLHFRACTLVGPLCTSMHIPPSLPPLYFGHKKDIVSPKTGPNCKCTSNLGPAQAHTIPLPGLRTPVKSGNFLWKEFIWLQNCPVCFRRYFLCSNRITLICTRTSPGDQDFIPHGGRLYTTKRISTQCYRIFRQTSLRWEMHTAGTVYSRAGAEGASTDFWKPWIICHFPCSVTERPLCFPPPASFSPSLLLPLTQLSWVISKENRELFLLSIPPTPPCFS